MIGDGGTAGSDPPGPVLPSAGWFLPISGDNWPSDLQRVQHAVPAGGVFIYALGGGAGHLQRAAAVCRSLAVRGGSPPVVLTNSSWLTREPMVRLQLSGGSFSSDPTALARLVERLLAAIAPRVWVVDAFPAGILGELSPLISHASCPTVALVRLLKPEWSDCWELRDVLRCYQRVFWIEPGAELEGVDGTGVPPILIRSSEELEPDTGGRADGPRVRVVTSGGTSAEQGIWSVVHTAMHRAAIRGVDLEIVSPGRSGFDARTPFFQTIRRCDLVIGACGYHLAHETQAASVPAIFIPQPRTYDDQLRRAASRPHARSPEQLEALLPEVLAADRPPFRRFENGANLVAAQIHDWCNT